LSFFEITLLALETILFNKLNGSVILVFSKIGKFKCKYWPGNPYWRGRLGTVDLRVLNPLDHLLLMMQTLFTFFKTACVNEEVTCTESSLSDSIPCINLSTLAWCEYGYFYFFTKQATLMRSSNVMSFPFQLVFPVFTHPPLLDVNMSVFTSFLR